VQESTPFFGVRRTGRENKVNPAENAAPYLPYILSSLACQWQIATNKT
jgi:hypothetical protein